MSSLKDNERIYLIIKVYLDIFGPSTAKGISEYIRQSPINIQTEISSRKIAQMLKGNAAFKKSGKRVKLYEVKK